MASGVSVTEFIGVYDASSKWTSELVSWVGSRLGLRHCGLCSVTHGTFREKSSWRASRDLLPAPFVTYHRDEQPEDVRVATGAALPMVLARTSAGLWPVLGAEDIEGCAGSPSVLIERLLHALAECSLVVPGSCDLGPGRAMTHDVEDLSNGPAQP